MRGEVPLKILAAGVVATLALTPMAHGAAPTTTSKKNTKMFSLAAGKTRTFDVPYPDALKFANAKYSGKVEVLAPASVKNAQQAPDLKKVKVLSKGSAIGGSVYRARLRNGNATGTAPVRVRVTAITMRPAR